MFADSHVGCVCIFMVCACVWAPSVFGSVVGCGWPEAFDSRLWVCGEGTELSWYILMVLCGRFGGNLRVRTARPWCRGMRRVGGFLLRVASRMHVATQNAPPTPETFLQTHNMYQLHILPVRWLANRTRKHHTRHPTSLGLEPRPQSRIVAKMS